MKQKKRYSGFMPTQPEGAPEWEVEVVRRHRPGGYRASQSLVDAVNVAIILGKPLLVTGEPGAGKTELAWSVAWQLGFHPPYTFETRSTSNARDLFYTYDAIRHFRLSQANKVANVLDFLNLNALGKAILYSNSKSRISSIDQRLSERFNERSDIQTVVLIDEIDKAPRDFPNDLLNEFAEQYFTIPEFENHRIDANRENLPLLILTSNSEKNLPAAFLRRCIFHNIQFPEREDLKNILYHRVGEFTGSSSPLFEEAVDFFIRLRELDPPLEKRPATAELIDWLRVLNEWDADWQAGLGAQAKVHQSTLGTLIKDRRDMDRVREIIAGD